MIKNWLLYITQVITFAICLYVNYLANALPINGYTSKEVSDMFYNKIVPAPFTFSIWGLIYALLAGYLIYYLIVLVQKKEKQILQFEGIAPFFIALNLLNPGWMYFWHQLKPGFALILMAGILISLIIIFLKTRNKIQMSMWPRASFEVYFGWICVATVANATAFLVSKGYDDISMNTDIIAIFILLVLITIGLIVSLKYRTVVYSLTLAWAFFGLWSNVSTMDVSALLVYVPLIGLVIFLLLGVYNATRSMMS